MDKFITEISYEDFMRMGLIGYRNTKVEMEDNSYKLKMLPIDICEEVRKNLEFCEEEGYTSIAVALHIEPTDDAIDERMKLYTSDGKGGRRHYTYEEAYSYALYDYSYLDKFMNRFTGQQTFQIGCGIDHIYSNRDYWYSKGDYWQVRKRDTKAIYLIRLNPNFVTGNKFNVGDTVRIDLDKVQDNFKKYNKNYIVRNIRKSNRGVILYKLAGVPDWGTEDMLIKVGKDE